MTGRKLLTLLLMIVVDNAFGCAELVAKMGPVPIEEIERAPRLRPADYFNSRRTIERAIQAIHREAPELLVTSKLFAENEKQISAILTNEFDYPRTAKKLKNAALSIFGGWNKAVEELGFSVTKPQTYVKLMIPESERLLTEGLPDKLIQDVEETAAAILSGDRPVRKPLLEPGATGQERYNQLHQVMNFFLAQAQELSDSHSTTREVLQSRSAKIKKAIIQLHEGLKIVIRNRLAKKWRDNGWDLSALDNAMDSALVRAVELFDPSKGHRFSTYYMLWIKGKTSAAIRKMTKDGRNIDYEVTAPVSDDSWRVSELETRAVQILVIDKIAKTPSPDGTDKFRRYAEILRRRRGLGHSPFDYAEEQIDRDIGAIFGVSRQAIAKMGVKAEKMYEAVLASLSATEINDMFASVFGTPLSDEDPNQERLIKSVGAGNR